jgi:hypothetical protein
VVEAVLVRVRPTDPLVYTSIVLVRLVAGPAAAWIPARRVSRMDPVALRAV